LSAGAAEAGVVEAVASSATSVDAAATATAATAAIREKTKVAVLERRVGARAQTLARRRGSEASDVLRSPEPAMPELEISWMSEEREEQEEEELDLEPSLPEPNEEQECQLPRQQGWICSCCLSRNHDTAYPFCVCCGYKFL
jgi:Mg-chelatase subunit ChlI